mmetsp:Transcript_22792/g.52090  ORF Transcript_22792/g.52090 Transcript_22792/m.52090 type:complete len:334 (+) Transcript_22792:104-1105(+)
MGNGAVQAAISTVQAPKLPLLRAATSEEAAEPANPLTKGLLHRRQVLLSNEHGIANPFELLPPIVQLSRPAWEHNESRGDPACRRLGYEAMEELRKQAQVVQEADGLLGEYAIELLGLGLRTGSSLSQRLFRVAQVSLDENRPQRVSFYELIALQSILACGTPEELEHLLFCIFDEDEDDLISAQDFASTVAAFSALKQDGESSWDAMSQQQQAKAMAEEVLEQYGSKVRMPRALTRLERLSKARGALHSRKACALCSCRSTLDDDLAHKDELPTDSTVTRCLPCTCKKEEHDLVIAPLTFTQWQLWFQRFVSQSEVCGSVGLGDMFHTGHKG